MDDYFQDNFVYPPFDFSHHQIPLYAPIPVSSQSLDIHHQYLQQQQFYPQDQTTFPTPSQLLVEISDSSTPSEDTCPTKHVESARKSRRRAIASNVGFLPTDPDTISSHEKKRHYLDCLEQYVMYLHHQFNLIGAVPTPLNRISTLRGLSSRSIRTLLVHMENSNRKLHLKTTAEEQRFMALRDEVVRKELLYAAMNQQPDLQPF